MFSYPNQFSLNQAGNIKQGGFVSALQDVGIGWHKRCLS